MAAIQFGEVPVWEGRFRTRQGCSGCSASDLRRSFESPLRSQAREVPVPQSLEEEVRMPPEPLVAWTEYIALLAATITAVRALWKGGTVLHFKARELRATARN